MQEEVTRKTIALAIKAAKLDGKMLQAALRKLLQLYRKARDTPHHGKQTLKQLMRHTTMTLTRSSTIPMFWHRSSPRCMTAHGRQARYKGRCKCYLRSNTFSQKPS